MKRVEKKKSEKNPYFKKFLVFIGFSIIPIFMFAGFMAVLLEPEPLENRLSNDLNLDISQANHVKNIFKQIGIEDYTSIVHDGNLDNVHKLGEKGYRMSNHDAKNIILYITADAKFVKVKYGGEVLYATGSTQNNLLSLVFTDDEKIEYQTKTMLDVKRILISPKTADFPLLDSWKFGKINGEVVVQGFVDAENALGNTIRSDFQAKYKSGALISLIFDGKEYVNY